ncbi:hypothetical protein ABZ734_11630 [Streptomyces sp. NPDC006660]
MPVSVTPGEPSAVDLPALRLTGPTRARHHLSILPESKIRASSA